MNQAKTESSKPNECKAKQGMSISLNPQRCVTKANQFNSTWKKSESASNSEWVDLNNNCCKQNSKLIVNWFDQYQRKCQPSKFSWKYTKPAIFKLQVLETSVLNFIACASQNAISPFLNHKHYKRPVQWQSDFFTWMFLVFLLLIGSHF